MAILQVSTRPVSKSIDHLLNDLFVNSLQSNYKKDHLPFTNIYESDQFYELDMRVPGMNKADFKISLEKSILTVSYEAIVSPSQGEKKLIRQEYKPTSFQRSFHVDESIETEKIQAHYENGILSIHLPKKQSNAEPNKTISID